MPWFEARKKELANRSLIRDQAFGESRSTPTSWSGSAATRSTSIESSNGRRPCCYVTTFNCAATFLEGHDTLACDPDELEEDEEPFIADA